MGARGRIRFLARAALAGSILLAPRVAGAEEPGALTGGTSLPAVPDTPLRYKLAASWGVHSWDQTERSGEIDQGSLYGLEIEHLMREWIAIRLTTLYGRTSYAFEGESAEIDQYLIELFLNGRLSAGPLASLGVVPYAGILGGSVVHDPEGGGLRTRSQSGYGFGVGMEYAPVGRFGVQVDWRRATVRLENPLRPESGGADEVDWDRFAGSLYWRF